MNKWPTIVVFMTDYGTYYLPTDEMLKLPTDRRTKQGKLRHRWEQALFELDAVAFELGMTLVDVVPRDKA